MNPNPANNRRFQVYRPPKPSNRMEGAYFNDPKRWAPSIHYHLSVEDVRNQMTPAEFYRYQLVTSGKEIRALQRLEWRWMRNYSKFLSAAQLVQRVFRGWNGRKYFYSIKRDLEILREQREAQKRALELFEEGEFQLALETTKAVAHPSIRLQRIKAKILYLLENFVESDIEARKLIEMDRFSDDGYFILASSLVKRGKLELAYQELKHALAILDIAGENIIRLCGFLCMKLNPPKIEEAFENFNSLVQRFPEDMNALMFRACSYSCLQEWKLAIDDYSLILFYQPQLPNIRCLRARCYACMRRWEEAKKDYLAVLELYPDYSFAQYGLDAISDQREELPMIDEALVNDAMTNYS